MVFAFVAASMNWNSLCYCLCVIASASVSVLTALQGSIFRDLTLSIAGTSSSDSHYRAELDSIIFANRTVTVKQAKSTETEFVMIDLQFSDFQGMFRSFVKFWN
jgi:hypothetical protein